MYGSKSSSYSSEHAWSFTRRAKDGGSVEFVLIAEAGVLERQALLLCESIRRFTGAYSQSAITVVSPRNDRRPSCSTLRKFDRLNAEYLPIEIESCCSEYGTSFRVHSVAHVARRRGPPVIVQLDSDTIFLSEPDLSLSGNHAAARPVDMKGMCTTGSGDRFDDYWRQLSALVGVDYEKIPTVETTVDHQTVLASHNGGFVAGLRACDIFERTEEIFKRLVAAGMKPWIDGPVIRTGTGILNGAATTYWGTSQAAFSLAAVAGNHPVRLFPDTYNVPLHCLSELKTQTPARWVHVHYHWLFGEQGHSNPMLNGELDLPREISEWLSERLPLALH